MRFDMHTFYEFFAGGGMARHGLGPDWQCLWANDIDPKKCAAYRTNWGDAELTENDIASVSAMDLPGRADLAWASFPCQDLSVAGNGQGLEGERSGTFWQFWRVIEELKQDNRPPQIIVIENVMGLVTSSGGDDFKSIISTLASAGYLVGAIHVNADILVPQSRPRVFIVAVSDLDEQSIRIVRAGGTHPYWHNQAIVNAWRNLDNGTGESWVWWSPWAEEYRSSGIESVIETKPSGVEWDSPEKTKAILAMMSDVGREKVLKAQQTGKQVVGTIYKRTRVDRNGQRVQRAEARFDGIAGCLRTPAGGSSRQTVIVVECDSVRTRLLSPREAARLMGLPDSYVIPTNYNEAYHLMGDGVVAPVVSMISESILKPILGDGWLIREVPQDQPTNQLSFIAS